MLEIFKAATTNQFEAAFGTLDLCLVQCPDACWNAPVANATFCQVMFHTLFFADYYLGENEAVFPEQDFHRQHRKLFADYEQLEDRKPESIYDKESISTYLCHCRDKAKSQIAAESTASLAAKAEFARRDFSRAELYIYNLRHVYHHAAQLVMRLRIDSDVDIPWINSGWPVD